MIDELELKDITAVHARAEELGRNKDYREQFDVCVSRAVANLSSLSEYCIPFVKVGGKFISYKSGSIEEEVAEAKKAVFVLGGKVTDVYKFDLYEQKRSFVVIDKENIHRKHIRGKPALRQRSRYTKIIRVKERHFVKNKDVINRKTFCKKIKCHK